MLDREIEEAVGRELNWLLRYRMPPPFDFSVDANEPMNAPVELGAPVFPYMAHAARCLRIEVTTEIMNRIEAIWRGANQFRRSRHGQVGPARFMDVAVYEIQWPATLPPPGWRVVNPFRKEG